MLAPLVRMGEKADLTLPATYINAKPALLQKTHDLLLLIHMLLAFLPTIQYNQTPTHGGM